MRKTLKYAVAAASTLSGLLAALVCYMQGMFSDPGLGVTMIPRVSLPSSRGFLLGITIVMVSALAPAALGAWLYLRWERRIITATPKMLDDLAALVRSGLPFAEAFFTVAQRNYGPLSKVLRRIASQIAMGADFSEAVEACCKDLPVEAKRYFYLLVEAYMSGGRIAEVLGRAAEHVRALRRFEESRESSLKAYMAIIVAAMIVLYTISLAVTFFAVKSEELTEKLRATGAAGIALPSVSIERVTAALYYTSLVVTVCASLVVGKVVKGKAVAGLVMMVPLLILGSLLVIYSEEIVRLVMRMI